jgi:hypothetical protein
MHSNVVIWVPAGLPLNHFQFGKQLPPAGFRHEVLGIHAKKRWQSRFRRCKALLTTAWVSVGNSTLLRMPRPTPVGSLTAGNLRTLKIAVRVRRGKFTGGRDAAVCPSHGCPRR